MQDFHLFEIGENIMRIDAMLNSLQINTENLAAVKDLLSKLQPGDVIRAQIMDFISNEVLLKLFDSTMIKASVQEDFSAEIGKFKNFVVKENQPDQLVLQEIKKSGTEQTKDDSNLLKALTKLDIPRTEENIKLAKTISENNLPLTREVFDNSAKILSAYKEIDIAKAVIMEANKIDVTPASVKQLGLLEKGSISLGNELNELMSMLDDAAQSIAETNNSDNTKNMAAIKAGSSTVSSDGETLNQGTATEIKANIEANINTKVNENNVITAKNEADKAVEAEKSMFDAKSFLKLVEDSMEQTGKCVVYEKTGNTNEKAAVNTTEEVSNSLNTDKKVTSELKNEIEKLFVKLEDIESEKKLDLEKNIKSLGEKLDKIKEEINTQNLPNKEVLIQKVDNIINQLKFIDDIRSFGYYVPIPLKLNGNLGEADLYVLKRNKNKKISPDDATVFLALDTINMGRVETLLSVSKKTISLNMRLEEKEYEDYIKTRFIDLYNMLSQNGYKLTDIKYRITSEPTNIFNINKVAKDMMSSQSRGVDIRL